VPARATSRRLVATWLDARDPPAYLVLGGLDPIVADETEGRPLYGK